jgi:hypothetical protein
MVAELAYRYISLYGQLTGKKFETNVDEPVLGRIEKSLKGYSLA